MSAGDGSQSVIMHIITSLGDGGAQRVLHELCVHDSDTKHRVVALAGEDITAEFLREAGVEVTCLGMVPGRLSPSAIWRLWQIIRRERPVTIQTWMYHADLIGGVVARLAGRSAIYWGIHHTELKPGKSTRSTIVVARVCVAVSRFVPRRIVCCATRARDVHTELGYRREIMVVIPNGYDFDKFCHDPEGRSRLRSKWEVDARTPVLGMVARFDPQKDHRNLLRACEILCSRGFRFRIALVGEDVTNDNAELTRWLNVHGLRDKTLLLGQQSNIPALMSAFDLHVLPSLYGEAFPNVLSEAMACGTPCVATDVGDAAKIVGSSGWVVPPGDHVALADAVETALNLRKNSTEEWSTLRGAARAHVVAHFDISQMVARYHDVWAEIERPLAR